MDHNLGDALNLDSSMGVDFGNPDDVVNQADIILEDSGHEVGIPMEFEHIEEQPMLMDTGSEEIIDFIGEQFTLQEYADHGDPNNILSTSAESIHHSILAPQSDIMIELGGKSIQTMTKQDLQLGPHARTIAAKTPLSPTRLIAPKRTEPEVFTTAPRQIAIAPKPPPGQSSKTYIPGKQFAIAPKPIALLTGKSNNFLKKVTLTGVVQANNKGNSILSQFGKQLVMMPAGGGQKLKLVTAGSAMPTVQYLRTSTGDQTSTVQAKNVTHNKPIVTKLILQGQSNMEANNSHNVFTKVTPVSSAKSPTRFVTMQHKTVPVSLGNKVLLATPTKSGVKFAKKQQIIAFKSPEKNLQAAQGTTKKVVIKSNPPQNVILKTTAPPKTAKLIKDGNFVVEGQKSQLHQINVPGKGIQYIRLITNSNTAPAKPKPQPQAVNLPGKTFLLTDTKGNLIQMSSEKAFSSSQPPPLVMTSNTGEQTQLSVKTQKKLVRIAPFVNKTGQTITTSRSSQSLLAPLSPMSEAPLSALDVAEDVEEIDSKAALRALVADALHENKHEMHEEEMRHVQNEIQDMQDMHDTHDPNVSVTEVEVEFKRDFYSDCEDNNESMDQHNSSGRSEEHPLIVIPSNYIKETDGTIDSQSGHDDSHLNSILSVDADVLNAYQSPRTPQALSESDIVSTELGLRPRKACNCTKSQCLKLYCECFANGEFCNRCNCNNCHNNLENEEQRQKAIRGCLDRNPNAFRPKIGKAKIGGPEIVRRHNKGCNCKRSGCLKNYCECYEAKIACTSICKCVGCRNVEETLERGRRRGAAPAPADAPHPHAHPLYRPHSLLQLKQPCSFMTTEVIEAVCQCLIAAGGEARDAPEGADPADPARDVIDEFARCLQDIIGAAHHAAPISVLDEGPA